jgi:ubiquinone/menaquinone biosynthesis C-methylase UbiE
VISPFPRQPSTAFFDGKFYAVMVDPMLDGLHGFVAGKIPEGSRVLDVGCGTGALAFKLAPGCREVLGVDLSPRMIQYAEGERRKRGCLNVRFQTADAAHLDGIDGGAFDVAVMLLVLHEMPREFRMGVLLESLRVARKAMLVDFAAPMPWNVGGIRNRLIETAAGFRHFLYFSDFSRRGGLKGLIQEAGVVTLGFRTVDSGNVAVYTVSAK